VNGWLVQTNLGVYGTDYLLRAAIAKKGLGANAAEEAIYPLTVTDVKGSPLTGANNYTIHFNPGQTPPVKGFWSVTMYNSTSYLVPNPINRPSAGSG
jgi:hypothetical protein